MLDSVFRDARTIPQLLRRRVERSPRGSAVRFFRNGVLNELNWQQLASAVVQLAIELARSGLEAGQCVGIYGSTSVSWALFDLACHELGLVVVGIHPGYSPEEVGYCLDAVRPRLVVADPGQPHATLEAQLSKLALPCAKLDLIACSMRWLDDAAALELPPIDAEAAPTDGAALAAIAFSSGTSGRHKGVLLSQENLVAAAVGSYQQLGIGGHGYRSFHWLPFAHLFGRLGLYLDLVSGACAFYGRGQDSLVEDLQVARPHFLFAVPKVTVQACG